MTQQTNLWAHQPPAIEYLNTHPASMLDAAMSSGKSFITVQNIRHCAAHRNAKSLILCPAAVLGVWRGQFMTHAPDEFDVIILDGKGNAAKKAQRLYESFRMQQSHGRPLVVVVNYESFWLPAIWNVLNSVVWDKHVCDESHRIKSARAKCSIHAWKIGQRAVSRTALTGTPMPNEPGDIFAQYRWLDERIFGRFWGKFKDEFAVMSQYIPQKVDKWINMEVLNEKINRIRYHIPKSVLVLPDKQHITIEVSLSPAGMKTYEAMKKESIASIKQMSDGTGEENIRNIVASNGAVQFLRLLQLAQGYATDDEGEEVNTDTEKRRALLDLLQDLDEPVCVYGWFKHDLACVEKCCRILGRRYGELSGRRKDLTSHSKMPDDIDVIAVQCKSGSAGIDLTRSRVGIIMNSGLLSPGDFDQMISRQHRVNQQQSVVFYHLVTQKTVETKLIDERGRKRDVIEALLSELFT